MLKAPFPWFGGKSRVADIVWDRFGDVANYVEPFFGSGAVLLARPHPPRIETVNDLDCMVANFWRAVQSDPEAVAQWCDWPVNEADLHARHLWLVQNLPAHRERLRHPGGVATGLCHAAAHGGTQDGTHGLIPLLHLLGQGGRDGAAREDAGEDVGVQPLGFRGQWAHGRDYRRACLPA